MSEKLIYEEESYAIKGACMEVYKNLGNGFLELVYQECLEIEFRRQGILFVPQKPFQYNDKGSMAIIGRNKAVVDLPKPKVHFKGFFAWLAWLFVHLMSLSMPRNKVNTLYHWALAYFSKNSSLRMIIRPEKKIKL